MLGVCLPLVYTICLNNHVHTCSLLASIVGDMVDNVVDIIVGIHVHDAKMLLKWMMLLLQPVLLFCICVLAVLVATKATMFPILGSQDKRTCSKWISVVLGPGTLDLAPHWTLLDLVGPWTWDLGPRLTLDPLATKKPKRSRHLGPRSKEFSAPRT